MTWLVFLVMIFPLRGQSLFEEALSGASGGLGVSLNGHVRALTWMGERRGSSSWEQKALYSEAALKLRAVAGGVGEAYAEVRLRGGLPGSFEGNGPELREAWVSLSLGPLDLCLGKQVNVWGRADSYSPVDNITPVNALFHSPETDDLRLGNYLLTARLPVGEALSFEGVWIPVYAPSVLPLDPGLDPRIVITGTDMPAPGLKNSGYAFRLRYDRPAWGMSLSWFDGYEPYPGLLITGFEMEGDTPRILLTGTPFREQVAGIAFETTPGDWGVRGETAWRRTTGYHDNYYRAWPDLRWTLGIDHAFGLLTVLFQYTGRWLTDYEAPVGPGTPGATPDRQMAYFNRMMFRQLDRTAHMLSLQPRISFLHEELQAEVYAEYNLTTSEYLIYPRLSWQVSDNVRLAAGGNLFHGPPESLYDMVRPLMNGIYVEARVSF